MKISKDVGCNTVMKAIEQLVNSYSTSSRPKQNEILRKLSEIVIMILKSEKQSGNSESLLSQIYANTEMKAKFEELEWVPIGSQIGMKSELCTWSEFYLPTTDFDAIWGSNRTHPILTDLEARRLQVTLILAMRIGNG